MRSAILLIGAFASVTLAQGGIPGLAQCAGACLGNGFGGCSRLDVKCICSNTALISDLSCCVKYNCPQSDQDSTIQFANAICAGQNVRNLPQSASCAPGQQPTGAAGASVSVTRTDQGGAQQTGGSSSSSGSPSANTTPAGTSSGAGAQQTPSGTSSSGRSGAAPTQAAAMYGLGGLLAGAGALIAAM